MMPEWEFLKLMFAKVFLFQIGMVPWKKLNLEMCFCWDLPQLKGVI